MTLKLININKSFSQGKEKINILNDFNLSVEKGEIVAITGESGCGKTTLLQIIGLLDSANSGQVIIDNVDTAKMSDKERTKIRRNKLGFIYQSHHLLPEFSAIENVEMPLLIQGVKKKEAEDRAKEILVKLNLEHRLHHHSSELSGGEQQRIAIARAVVSNPMLILADEPTGNLDSNNSDIVFNIFIKLAKDMEISVLVVTHSQDLASKTDRIINMN